MAKAEKIFYCNECGARYHKWIGKCEDCGQWNTVSELVSTQNKSPNQEQGGLVFISLSNEIKQADRKLSDIVEFDRVLGGGAVPGSVILIGGDPGIGKSTLLLQVLSSLSQEYVCIYISGEESAEQIKLRAVRVGANESNIKLACESNISLILNSLNGNEDFLVIDSIQTLHSDVVESVPGTISQVKYCTYELINYAKTNNTTVFLVGHITKDGMIAGPKILEHMVDTVIYFAGERGNSYRILRAVKNRFGPCDELGIFEMQQKGLMCVTNPSVLFLTQREEGIPGTTAFSGMEGSRPILVEVHALVAKSYFPSPRRTVVGCDLNRLFMILAVFESKCKILFSDYDVYISIAGGIKVTEPAGDLAIALSLLSARSSKIIAKDICAFGEIGLTGEIRSVSRCSERIKEAEKMGFKNVVIPYSNHYDDNGSDIKYLKVKTLLELVNFVGKYNEE